MKIPPVALSKEQVWRLKLAHAKKFWGHLATWKELFLYQMLCNDIKQIKEISYLAYLEKRGEIVMLPFDELPVRKFFVRKLIDRLGKIQTRKEVLNASTSSTTTS